jgi:two-component sensor histidine kinase
MMKANAQSYRVVIAEDDVWVAREIRRLVVELGYELVGEAHNGSEAVRLVCEQKPDVVLMDIEMPELDGLEASQTIQETCPTPIVILTAYENDLLLERARTHGVGAYLIKPTNGADIARAVGIAVARHQDLMQLREALRKEKVLRREFMHRVKNNLAMITSLLHVQISGSDDARIKAALRDCANRVQALSVMHDMLRLDDNPTTVRLDWYLTAVVQNLQQSASNAGEQITFTIATEELSCHSELAVSCGLIVNELLTNVIKHAFPQDTAGTVAFTLKRADRKMMELSVLDNGIGLPAGLDPASTTTMGLQIVSLLVQQNQGELESVRRPDGTEFRIRFPIEEI